MNIIEETLFEKTKEFQDGQVYSDQWKFAKSYMPKVLDTISHVFPHYSLHNSTHSEAIINNIVRIVGAESIKKLSVVDLWLLLASAYYHDCGMVVSGEDKTAIFDEGSDFVKYVKEKQEDALSPMNEYAVLFDIKENKIYYKDERLTSESYEAARFLLASFIRDTHAERSGKKIETEKSLHFPGDPIPDRIIRILKLICNCHTKDVGEVMNLQPIESSGCGIEDCHPRFVAAMLRLGDLLDVDSNRVSEVLLSTLGSIPSDSKFYNKTNRNITHIRIDRSVIEITAECDDYHVAGLINRWFESLNDELVFYMKRWHQIIPFESFGYLPTVGDLKVNLTNYDTFDGKKRPSFEIDSSKAIELLQGAGLYTESCECIREILQNAVDATYFRVYKECPGINSLKEFKDRCENYPIVVRLDRIDPLKFKGIDARWKIEIVDKGIGMTKEDLQFLSKTGSSGSNMEKKQLVRNVPEFLRPSGTFGIGFQSVFLIADKVNVVTRKINKDSYVKAEMYNPSGKESGAILIQSIEKEDVDYGTTIGFEFHDHKDDSQRITYDDRFSVAEFASFDFAKNKEVNLLGMKVMDEVARFASGTFIPVEFYLDGERKRYVSQNKKIAFGDIDEETGLQLLLEKTNAAISGDVESKVYFRNQLVRGYYLQIPFLRFHVNVLKGNAKDVLTLDRDRVRKEYSQILRDSIYKSVIKYLDKKIDSLDATRKPLASMCLELYQDYMTEKSIAGVSAREYWKSYKMKLRKTDSGEEVSIPLGDLLTADSIERIYKDSEADLLVFEMRGVKYEVSYEYDTLYWTYMFIIKMAQKQNYSLTFKEDSIVLYKGESSIIEDTPVAREKRMYEYMRHANNARGLFPCEEKYSALQVNKEAFSKWEYGQDIFDYPYMICPYVRKYNFDYSDEAVRLEYDVDAKVLNTVYENRVDSTITKEQIRRAYDAFKNDWNPIVEKVNAKAKKEPPQIYRYRGFEVLL